MFERALTLQQLLEIKRRDGDWRVIAGGTDLMVESYHAGHAPGNVVDISAIEALHRIEWENGRLFVGAAATFTEIEHDALLRQYAPLLCRAAAEVGSPQIRNRGTVGGNAANASPAADSLPVLAAMDAEAAVRSAENYRLVKISELIASPGKNTLAADEVIEGFLLTPLESGVWQQSYKKIGRRNALAISRITGACALQKADGRIADVRLSLGAVFPAPRRLARTEALLREELLSGDLLCRAGEQAVAEIEAVAGRRASAAYKFSVVSDLIAALVKEAWEQEGEKK